MIFCFPSHSFIFFFFFFFECFCIDSCYKLAVWICLFPYYSVVGFALSVIVFENNYPIIFCELLRRWTGRVWGRPCSSHSSSCDKEGPSETISYCCYYTYMGWSSSNCIWSKFWHGIEVYKVMNTISHLISLQMVPGSYLVLNLRTCIVYPNHWYWIFAVR